MLGSTKQFCSKSRTLSSSVGNLQICQQLTELENQLRAQFFVTPCSATHWVRKWTSVGVIYRAAQCVLVHT